ncbi:nucleotidyltransferase family protein [uncultured Maribacter sp.]|uniref:nucleotidyltransferase family protein n=1 Tax=uncultured Maribacter sp. TaxID=431308 RepID=UPI0030DDBCFB
MNENLHVVVLIMAAGASRRMKGVKQLLPWKNSNFLTETIKTVQKSKARTVSVVLGSHAERIKRECNLTQIGVDVILNPNWDEGLGNSIAIGVKEILKKIHDLDGILICLADQPLLTSDYFDSLIYQFKKDTSKIVATNYGKRVGVPALFPKFLFNELECLNGDQGARDLLKNHIKNIISLDAENQQIDIDTEEEYHKLIIQTKIKNEE